MEKDENSAYRVFHHGDHGDDACVHGDDDIDDDYDDDFDDDDDAGESCGESDWVISSVHPPSVQLLHSSLGGKLPNMIISLGKRSLMIRVIVTFRKY